MNNTLLSSELSYVFLFGSLHVPHGPVISLVKQLTCQSGISKNMYLKTKDPVLNSGIL